MSRTALKIVNKFFPKVTRVVDAADNIQIEVTTKDTRSARVRDHSGCAMAVACKRAFHADGVIVSVSRAYLIKGNKAYRFNLPQAAAREIISFDRNGDFAPGFYQLNAPCESHALGSQRGSNKNQSGPGKGYKRTAPRHITEGIRTVLGSREVS